MRRIISVGEEGKKSRRLLWAVLLIGLIGTAAGAFVLFSQPGHVKVVPPSISVTVDLEYGEISQGGSSSHSFTITNTGDSGVKLTYGTNLDPSVGALTLVDSVGTDVMSLPCLAAGGTVSGNAVLSIEQAATPNVDYDFTLTINGEVC